MSDNGNGEWFLCISCGKRAGYFPHGFVHDRARLPPGAVVHDKPSCLFYKQASASLYALCHANVARLPQPDTLEPSWPDS
jgi:hypothetical protein